MTTAMTLPLRFASEFWWTMPLMPPTAGTEVLEVRHNGVSRHDDAARLARAGIPVKSGQFEVMGR